MHDVRETRLKFETPVSAFRNTRYQKRAEEMILGKAVLDDVYVRMNRILPKNSTPLFGPRHFGILGFGVPKM